MIRNMCHLEDTVECVSRRADLFRRRLQSDSVCHLFMSHLTEPPLHPSIAYQVVDICWTIVDFNLHTFIFSKVHMVITSLRMGEFLSCHLYDLFNISIQPDINISCRPCCRIWVHLCVTRTFQDAAIVAGFLKMCR